MEISLRVLNLKWRVIEKPWKPHHSYIKKQKLDPLRSKLPVGFLLFFWLIVFIIAFTSSLCWNAAVSSFSNLMILSPKLGCFRNSHVLSYSTVLGFMAYIIMYDKLIEREWCHMRLKTKLTCKIMLWVGTNLFSVSDSCCIFLT